MDDIIIYDDINKSCCICFDTKPIYRYKQNIGSILQKTTPEYTSVEIIENTDIPLDDLYPTYFETRYLPDDILVPSCCGKHYICIRCLRKLVFTFDNGHPINENNSHVYCPYPFGDCVNDIGNNYIFSHTAIKNICKTNNQWNSYMTYAEKHAFPGYTIIKCPIETYIMTYSPCNSQVLVKTQDIRESSPGELIVVCNQNKYCNRRFCYHCRKPVSNYHDECIDCKISCENENGELLNRYFNKNREIIINNSYKEDVTFFHMDESDYLYKNKEITVDIAVSEILDLVNDVDNYMICPICKNSLYKTESCNGLTHHNIERCYACGRIGDAVRGLHIFHWKYNGSGGCYRFDTEFFVRKHIPEYICSELVCFNHIKGECNVEEHQVGVTKLNFTRKRAYVYHMLISLLKETRYLVYDTLFEIDNRELHELLPYKQSLILLDKYKERRKDYIEEILYENLHLYFPDTIQKFEKKNTCIEADEYINNYSIKLTKRSEDDIWYDYIHPLISRRYNLLTGRNNFDDYDEEISDNSDDDVFSGNLLRRLSRNLYTTSQYSNTTLNRLTITYPENKTEDTDKHETTTNTDTDTSIQIKLNGYELLPDNESKNSDVQIKEKTD